MIWIGCPVIPFSQFVCLLLVGKYVLRIFIGCYLMMKIGGKNPVVPIRLCKIALKSFPFECFVLCFATFDFVACLLCLF